MKKYQIVLSLFFIASTLFSEDIRKDYTGNVFAGGKERLVFQNPSEKNKILILSQTVNSELYDDSSTVRIHYRLKNRGNKAVFEFQYPRLDFIAVMDKLERKKAGIVSKTQETVVIKGEYRNMVMTVNGQPVNFRIVEKPDMIAYDIPFKNGHTGYNLDPASTAVQTSIQSYRYYYSFYTAEITLEKNEIGEIQLSYETPHYISKITGTAHDRMSEYEDPALNYEYSINADRFLLHSERIFCYFFFTNYSDEENRIEKLFFNIKSHVSNPEFLRVLPAKYRYKNKVITFRYSKFRPKPYHTIMLKNSSLYSKRSVCDLCFNVVPDKMEGERFDYFSVKPGAVIQYEYQNTYSPKLKKDDLQVREIRMKPVLIEKQSLKNQNLIRKIEIVFSGAEDSKKEVRIVKNLKDSDYQSFIKKNYIVIYKGKPVKCRNIHFTVREVSQNREEPVLIENFEILK